MGDDCAALSAPFECGCRCSLLLVSHTELTSWPQRPVERVKLNRVVGGMFGGARMSESHAAHAMLLRQGGPPPGYIRRSEERRVGKECRL